MNNKPTIILVILLFTFVFTTIKAQQIPQFTQFQQIQMQYSPAYVGSKEGVNVESIFRVQWLGIPGGPASQSVGVHAPMPKFNSGIGLLVNNSFIGVQRNTSLYANYAYHINIGKSKIALGVQAGAFQMGWRANELITPSGEYEASIFHNDALIPVGSVADIVPDLGAGLYFYSKKLKVGLSTLHLLQPNVTFATANSEVAVQARRHYVAHAHYTIEINRIWQLLPSILLRTDAIKYQTDINCQVTYDNFIIGALSFRGFNANTFDAVSITAGVRLNKVTIGYAYDLPLSPLSNGTTGSHELALQYQLKDVFTIKEKKIRYNTRFL